MRKIRVWPRYWVLIGLATAFSFSASCWNPNVTLPLKDFADRLGASAPQTPITDHGGRVVFHSPGELYVWHGFDCANARKPKSVHIKKTIDLPTDFFTGALVYLNGWKFKFKDEESELIGLGVAIGETNIQGKKLSWDAIGTIEAENAQDIEVCYYYTVIAWTKFMPDAYVLQQGFKLLSAYKHSGFPTALMRVSRYLYSPSFVPLEFAGVLPKGFGLAWGDLEEDYFLQAAYQLGPSERFVYGENRYKSHKYSPQPKLPATPNTVDYVKNGFVSWESTAIFKNGDSPDPFYFGDLVVGVGGNNFEMIDPHFGISPVRQLDGSSAKSGTTKKRFTVENLPFRFAAPVLKGWDVHLHIDDEQVREIGIWIDDFQYTWTGSAGTLTYNLVYTYSDDENSKVEAHPDVAIFGIKQLGPD